MKTIVTLMALAVLALLFDVRLIGIGLLVVTIVLLIGDLVAALPASSCNHNCRQSRDCTCRPAASCATKNEKESTL